MLNVRKVILLAYLLFQNCVSKCYMIKSLLGISLCLVRSRDGKQNQTRSSMRDNSVSRKLLDKNFQND